MRVDAARDRKRSATHVVNEQLEPRLPDAKYGAFHGSPTFRRVTRRATVTSPDSRRICEVRDATLGQCRSYIHPAVG
jgi:hypothetical protein